VAKSKELSTKAIQSTQITLMKAGFLINFKKSHLQPTQTLKFLGLELDSSRALTFLPLDKAQQLVQCSKYFMEVGKYRSVKLFLRLLGLMAASLLAVPHARLYMRPIQIYLNSQRDARIHNLQHPIMIPRHLLPIMHWWADLENLVAGLPWRFPRPSVTMTTDASLKAWGAHAQGMTVQGKWTKHQSSLHINVLELMAVQKGLLAFLSFLKNKSILVQTDNSTVISYINKAGGTQSPALCQVAWEICNLCIMNRIQLQAVHIPGSNNLLADKLSRHLLSPTEWELNDQVVPQLFHKWASPSVDLFASYQNKITANILLYLSSSTSHASGRTLNELERPVCIRFSSSSHPQSGAEESSLRESSHDF
jgi:hypothetical protein